MIRFEVHDRVGLATIDRPERRNALNAELCDDLRSRLDAHRDLRAFVVTGAGSAFCAGADLVTRFAPSDEPEHGGSDRFRPAFERLLATVVAQPAPVVAAVDGPAIGAGMQLAVACDVRVAGPRARFAIPGGRLGIHLSAGNIERLAALVGQGRARDFLLTGRSVDADDALATGLVERVAVDGALDAALELAADVAAQAPLTVQGHKRALALVAEAGALGSAARQEIAALEAAAFASDDLQEGMAAFAEKRAPRFTGR